MIISKVEDLVDVSKLLSSQIRVEMFKLLKDWWFVSDLADKLNISQAYATILLAEFEILKFVEIKLEKGDRSVRKYAKRKFDSVELVF